MGKKDDAPRIYDTLGASALKGVDELRVAAESMARQLHFIKKKKGIITK